MKFIHVEGLNCSGKSHYINTFFDSKFVCNTPWINPHRWCDNKKNTITDIESFIIGSYETILNNTHDYFGDKLVVFDRSFISSFVYGSIKLSSLIYLVELYSIHNNEIVFLNTDISICESRLLNRSKDRPYASDQSLVYICERFLSVIDFIEKISDFKINLITNGNGVN